MPTATTVYNPNSKTFVEDLNSVLDAEIDSYISELANGDPEEKYRVACKQLATYTTLLRRVMTTNVGERDYGDSNTFIYETMLKDVENLIDDHAVATMAEQWSQDSVDACAFRSLMGAINSDEQLMSIWDQLCMMAKLTGDFDG